MSGLLRRIKRSRPADAGEPLPEGQAAAPEGAAPATEPATGATEPLAPEAPAQPEAPKEKPVLLADPNTPAGVDPAAVPMRPPAGRRGRLRRRLRYLRRARELMLRDLGGLLYEIHRTGGGNVEAHGNIVRAKVQRIAGLDAEAHALETALAAPRGDAIVFQPGVGGTCPACGELYGSAARFCANCGTPIAAGALPAPAPAADPTPTPADPTPTPAPATRESVFGRPATPAQPLPSGDPLRAPGAEQPTASLAPASAATQATDDTVIAEPAKAGPADEPRATDETAVVEPGTAQRHEPAAEPEATQPADEPVADTEAAQRDEPVADTEAAQRDEPVAEAEATHPADEPAAETEAAEQPDDATDAAEQPGGGSERNPFSGLRNGRADDHTPPELSSGDPLATRKSGT